MTPEWHRVLDELADPYPGNRPESVVDDRTQLLAPIVRGDDCGRPLCDLRQLGLEHGHVDDRKHSPYFQPTQPRAEWDKKEHPCLFAAVAGMFLAAAVFAAGIVLGSWWF